jgi:hypothetical protein
VSGERGKLLFSKKEVSLSPPSPLSLFKKNGVLLVCALCFDAGGAFFVLGLVMQWRFFGRCFLRVYAYASDTADAFGGGSVLGLDR